MKTRPGNFLPPKKRKEYLAVKNEDIICAVLYLYKGIFFALQLGCTHKIIKKSLLVNKINFIFFHQTIIYKFFLLILKCSR